MTLVRALAGRGARRWALLLVLSVFAVAFALAGTVPALAGETTAPWWRVGFEIAPSYLPPMQEEGGKKVEGRGQIVIDVTNLGDGAASGAGGEPVIVTGALPAGLTATAIAGTQPEHQPTPTCTLATLQCTYKGVVNPYERLAVTISVKDAIEAAPGASTVLPVEASVHGGGAARAASGRQPATISAEEVPFGIQTQSYELAPFNVDGTPATQAGSHPFELTSSLVMNQTGQALKRQPVALPRNLSFDLPLGLVGDANATEQCTMAEFNAHAAGSATDLCPSGSTVGVASVEIYEPTGVGDVVKEAPLFDLVPSEGEPARFGFEVLGKVPVVIDTSVDPEHDYRVVASVQNATELAGLLSSQVTFWGVPSDPRHDDSRGWECIGENLEKRGGEPCAAPSGSQQALLTLPSSCAKDPASEPITSAMQLESWSAPVLVRPPSYVWSGPLEESLGLTGCNELELTPSIAVQPAEAHAPEVHAGSTPTGLSVDVKIPQHSLLEPNPSGRAQADVRDTTVTLPEGMQLNPSAANGLQACPQGPENGYEGIGFVGFRKFLGAGEEPGPETPVFTPTFRFHQQEHEEGVLAPSCPEASKLGTVHIKTPLLPDELEGALYLATPAPNGETGRNPFNSLVAMYLVAEDKQAGVLVKLAGEGRLDARTGRVSTTFRNTPQLPFEELSVELFGGERAALSTPPRCGDYAGGGEGVFESWSEASVRRESASPILITSGPEGAACAPSPLAFAPAFDAQSTNTQAGAFTQFTLEIERPDGEQALSGVEVRLPPGVAALLANVTPCQEPSAGQPWACGAASLIGSAAASVGLGREPYALEPGKVYLTSGYDGAPFGLLVEMEAKAGPFDLGRVYVRSRIDVNSETAAVTVVTDPGPHGDTLPTMLDGIPVQLKRLEVDVNRPDFEFNPSSCDPMSIEGTLAGAEAGTGAGTADLGVSSPFHLAGCAALPFAPKLSASVQGHASKVDGTSLNVGIESAGLGQANIAKVDLQLPLALSSRLETLQKACPDAIFGADPATCDEGSVIGSATVDTPVLKNPLSGPAYLVSHGGAAFPDVELVLQGEGITLILDGKTDIKSGITYSRFESAPDAPFTSFDVELPAGPHSVLTANVPEKEDFSLCKASLSMPTTITGHNGAVIEQTTSIAVTGCGEVKGSKVTKLTRAQLLAKALRACREKYRTKHNRRQRVDCEKQARKRYGAKRAPPKSGKKANYRKR
jgi:hypothetical protein